MSETATYLYSDLELAAIEGATRSGTAEDGLDAVWDPITLAHHGERIATMEHVDVASYRIDAGQHEEIGCWVSARFPTLRLDVGPARAPAE